MGASEGKLKEQFLYSIMANKEGRVNDFLTVSALCIEILEISLNITEHRSLRRLRHGTTRITWRTS